MSVESSNGFSHVSERVMISILLFPNSNLIWSIFGKRLRILRCTIFSPLDSPNVWKLDILSIEYHEVAFASELSIYLIVGGRGKNSRDQ